MNYHFKPSDFYEPIEAQHFVVVCTVKVDYDVDAADVAQQILQTLVEIDVLKPGEQFKIAKCGDLIVVVKGVHYLTLNPGVN